MSRPLVVAAHGTASATGRQIIEACAGQAGELLGVPVTVGYVDVCEPALADVITRDAVVVPLFLASGYHVRHDVPTAAQRAPGTSVTAPLGSAPAVVEALTSRLTEALGSPPRTAVDGVVLASAGSTQEAARTEVADLATNLGDRIGVPVSVAYLSGPGPQIAEVCAAHRTQGRRRIAVATHLLAAGVFLDRARRLGAESGVLAVSDELGTHPAISTLVAARYAAACA